MNEKLLAYAQDFVSFLMFNLKRKCSEINKIILFGSVARDGADNDSDIDIFIDTKNEKIETSVDKIKEEFYKSIKFMKYWKLLGIENDIKCIVGELKKWDKLRSSIIADGIMLYGKYIDIPEEGRPVSIVSWDAIKPDTRRVLFNKRIFGYNHGNKHYDGLLQKHNGTKLSSSVIIPREHLPEFINLFRKMKITARIRDVFEY